MARNTIASFTAALLLAMMPGRSVWADESLNKDFQNDSGQTADGFKMLLQGQPTITCHYDGPFSNVPNTEFNPPTTSVDGDGNTVVHWDGGAQIANGDMAHVGLCVSNSSLTILGIWFTNNGNVIGCGHQVTDNSGWHSVTSGNVSFANTAGNCQPETLTIDEVKVEWLPAPVPIEDLMGDVDRQPIRIDQVPGALELAPGEPGGFNLPLPPPPGAEAAVVIVQVTNGQARRGEPTGVVVDYKQYVNPEWHGLAQKKGQRGGHGLAQKKGQHGGQGLAQKKGRGGAQGLGLLASLLAAGGVSMVVLRRKRSPDRE